MPEDELFKISFLNEGTIYEIYARQVAQSNLFGFIEIEEFVFGENTSVVVDPTQEKLSSEFSHVKRTYIPLHNVVRIDEVSKQGSAKITELKPNSKSNVSVIPAHFYSKPDINPVE